VTGRLLALIGALICGCSEGLAQPLDPEARAMWELVNEARASSRYAAETGGDARALAWDRDLAKVARRQARHMLEHDYFAHVDPNGTGPSDRVDAAGIPWTAVGENIAWHGSVGSAHAAFMDEPPFQPNHRATILDPRFTHLGVGTVRDGAGRVIIVQVFRRG